MTRPVGFPNRRPIGLLLSILASACSAAVVSQDAVAVSPSIASLPPAGTASFVASVKGAALATGVVWSASGGFITNAGVYTAPTQLGSYQIQATYAGKTGLAAAIVGAPSAVCANMPLRSTGTIYYFCDCAAGSQAGCVAGSDANPGTSASAPKQTWSAAITAFNAINAGDTIALCKGGAWALSSTSSPRYCSFAVSNSRCAAGSSLTDPANTSTCDIRDYAPSWGGTARPLLAGSGDLAMLTRQVGSTNGVRILNLAFQGSNQGPNGGVYNAQFGVLTGVCGTPISDSGWLICNNTFDRLRLGIQGPTSGVASNIRIWGNTFTMNDLDAILFYNGSNNAIDSNLFDNNGGFVHPVTGNQAHTVYLDGDGTTVSSNIQVVNNEFRRTGSGGTVGPANTGILVGHGLWDYLNIENNIIDCGGGTTGPGNCWNMDLDNNVAAPLWTAFRHTTIRRNLLLGSSSGIAIGSDPGAFIENNIIDLVTTSRTWMVGIQSPYQTAKTGTPGDDVANNVTIRNNTIYISGPSGAYTGILVSTEGTGHVIANNTVTSGRGVCFSTTLPAGAYTFVGNEACYGGAAWGTTYDNTTHITSDPLFQNPNNPPSGFTPAAGSPLIGAGSAPNAPPTDFTLRTRPNPPSIGAYEP